MKIMKCPVCRKMIDHKTIRGKTVHWNPFKRRIIQCVNCGAGIKPKLWLFISWWAWVVIGLIYIFSNIEFPYANFIIFILFGFIAFSIYRGFSHEPV